MKKVLLTILVTAAVFAAGVGAGIWIQRTQPVPAPPIGLMGEIRDVPLTSTATAPKATNENLNQEIERMKPYIEEFKHKLEPIKAEFRDQLDAVLTAEQREKLKALSERNASATVTDASGKSRPRHTREGLDSLFPIVIVPNTLEKLTSELKLDATQQTAVQALLLKRRAKFLELVDTTPPPSLQLGRMAPLVPQIAHPPSK